MQSENRNGWAESRDIEIKGRFVPGLLFGGMLFSGAGVGLYWLYFAIDANPPVLVMGFVFLFFGLLFFYLLASAYAACFIVDKTGIVKTGLLRGVVRINWDDLGGAVEEPGVEHGLLKLKLVSISNKKIVVYSNWMNDYNHFFNLINSYIPINTGASRLQAEEKNTIRDEKLERVSESPADSLSSRASRTNVRLRVTGTQIFYFLGTLLVTALMIWRAIRR